MVSFAELVIVLAVGLGGLFCTLVLIACVGASLWDQRERERLERLQALAARKRAVPVRDPLLDYLDPIETAYRLPAREPERTHR